MKFLFFSFYFIFHTGNSRLFLHRCLVIQKFHNNIKQGFFLFILVSSQLSDSFIILQTDTIILCTSIYSSYCYDDDNDNNDDDVVVNSNCRVIYYYYDVKLKFFCGGLFRFLSLNALTNYFIPKD